MPGFLDLEDVDLAAGAHARRVDGTSLLEAVAWWAGEPHTDKPACVSPVVAAFVRGWADALTDDRRQQLKAWVPKLAATDDDGGDPQRALLLADWLTRTCAPAFCRAAGLQEEAGRLERAAAVTGWEPAVAVLPVIDLAAAAAGTRLEGAWANRGGTQDAPQAAHQATSSCAAAAAARALAVWVGDPGHTDLQGWLVAALRAALGHQPGTLAAALNGIRTLTLDGCRRAAADTINAAALAAALHAPPDGAWAALQPTVKHLQTTAFDLLEGLCAAGKVTVS